MRIISGTHKGRKINIPLNLKLRPTTGRAKEALFNIIDNRFFFEGKKILDLFSGTGNIAYEFASRGSENIVSVDKNIHAIKFIKSTTKKFDLNISPIQSDALNYVKNCKEKFNIIFADPPYSYNKYKEIKNLILENNLIKKDGLLIIEHSKNTLFNDKNHEVRKYGSVHFSIFSF